MNIEQGISNDEVLKTSTFEIPCSIFDIQLTKNLVQGSVTSFILRRTFRENFFRMEFTTFKATFRNNIRRNLEIIRLGAGKHNVQRDRYRLS